MANNPKVLIAGAGPVGMTMANELARRGISVRVVDKAPARTDKSKALVLWSRTLELLDDAGYVNGFLSAGMRAHGATISTGREIVARVAFDSIDSRYPFALMIPQNETERVLDEHLVARGVTVERPVELTGFRDTGSGIEATLKKAGGEAETVSADWLIGCDGAHSAVRHGLGLSFEGSTMQSDWALADGFIAGLEPKDRIHIFWHRDGILAFFPIVGDRWRVICDLGVAEGEGHRVDPTLEEIQVLLGRRSGRELVMSNPYWLACFRINERKVKDYRKGRVFLAGDAAHIHSPAGGQGMNTGMQDAFNLAWKLALVIQGSAAPALLDSYSPERSAVGDRVLRNAIVRFATGFPLIQHKIADQLTEMDIGYPDSPLTFTDGIGGSGPEPGERWPHPVPEGPDGARFTAIGPDAAVAALAQSFPRLVVAQPASEMTLRLIRPDGYVCFVDAHADRALAEKYLAAIAG